MEHIEYHGWRDCVRLSNNTVDLVASTEFGPRIMRFGFVSGENIMGEDPSLFGKSGPADKWVNYGGHRLWHSPEHEPRTYQPDNLPIEEALYDKGMLILHQGIEPGTGIGKQMRVTLGSGNRPTARVDHILANHNVWPVELAPWALSVVAPGGRIIVPQEPFQERGSTGLYGPARPIVLWPYAHMGDSRYTWGTNFIQVRSDASKPLAEKIGLFTGAGWAAFHSGNGDLWIKFIDTQDICADDCADMGCNFETYTAGGFQELETLGPLELLNPGEMSEHTEYWALVRKPDLPHDDDALAEAFQAIITDAEELIAESFHGE